MASGKTDDIIIYLHDRQEPLKLPTPVDSCEQLWRLAARHGLNVKPAALDLYGLRHGKFWLSPADPVPVTNEPLELRIRFKPPFPARLYEADEASFRYYYSQVRRDFDNSLVLKATSQEIIKGASSQNPKWYLPIPSGNNADPEVAIARKKRVALLSIIVKLVSLNIIIDIMAEGKEKKEILKNFDDYVPKYTFANAAEKMIGLKNLKQTSSKYIDSHEQDKSATLSQRKLEFLNLVESHFPRYFEEIIEDVELKTMGQSVADVVKLKIVPPFRNTFNPHEEIEPYLAIASSNSKEKDTPLCNIEEICNISTNKDEEKDTLSIEIARKNGIPLYITVKSGAIGISLLTTLSSYYRLCEKWIFCLCSDIEYPSLTTLLKSHVHGPVDDQFVREKFRANPARQQNGTYLIRQSCTDHFIYFLHYIVDSEIRELVIIQSRDTGSFSLDKTYLKGNGHIEECYNDISSLVKDVSALLHLKVCLHPSEFDRAKSLLICRSISAIEADIVGRYRSEMKTEHKFFIPLTALCKYENIKLKGRFTNVWKGKWSKNAKEREIVAIKQLKHSDERQLAPFMQMCYNTLLWNDPTLIKVHGATLAIHGNPMALVMEYLPLGPCDGYLKRNHEVTREELLEAATGLAKGLWYLEERNIVHSNIRLCNVFVAQHMVGSYFKVKLGDPGLPDYTSPEEVHWLSTELLMDSCPTPSKCTTKGDVWAFATTIWQLFSYGESPKLDLKFAKNQYIKGHRLSMPTSLSGPFVKIYDIMLGCWKPVPEERDSPQTLLKSLHQFLYKVVNTQKVHIYVTMKDPPQMSPSGSVRTLQTTAGSGDTITNMSSENGFAPPPDLPPPRRKPSKLHSDDEDDDQLQSFGTFPNTTNLVPTFTNWMQKFRDPRMMLGQGGGIWHHDSTQNLLSRSSSGMEGSVVDSYCRSEFTLQTSISSLSSSYASMPCIYDIDDGAQITFNKKILGEGNFGIVYLGYLTRSNGDWEQVAIKRLRNINDPESENEIERELNLMKEFNHDNIVRIRGVKRMEEEGITTMAFAMEYLEHGSLDIYLKTKKDLIKIPQLFLYADNIIEGMIYLSRKKIIHRDLAARNILVANEEQVKISDFGLARKPREKDYYTMTSRSNIPVKWMALESLCQMIFHTPSDVWSFAVVLWEMFSFGELPYLEGCEDYFRTDQGEEKLLTDMNNWIKKLLEGTRLRKPEKCSNILYTQVMMSCWEENPDNRPSFDKLKIILSHVEKQVT